jgi:hypothetical protein
MIPSTSSVGLASSSGPFRGFFSGSYKKAPLQRFSFESEKQRSIGVPSSNIGAWMGLFAAEMRNRELLEKIIATALTWGGAAALIKPLAWQHQAERVRLVMNHLPSFAKTQ